jgi:CheY-like chemotaxis protein
MPNVIVADNDMLIRDILRSALGGMGQSVFVAASGDEALALAETMAADLVVLDLNMPKGNGFQACERLRALPGYENTPIVILSAHDDDRVRRAVQQIGATLFLPKPFQLADLLLSLAPYLKVDKRTLAAVSQTAQRARQIAASDDRNRLGGIAGGGSAAMMDKVAAVLDTAKGHGPAVT